MKEENTILVSSNVEGMYRLYRNANDKVFGMLVQDYASVEHMGYGALESSYDSVVYADCVLDGVFSIIGCNVFGGTLGGASKVHSTSLDPVEINGNFRVEGNAQIGDTPLKGTGYIGDNAELKNGNVEGYIYMDGNAKYIPEKVEYPGILKSVVMRDNSKVLKQRSAANNHLKLRLYDNATINSIASTDRGTLIMRGNSYTHRANTDLTPLVYGTLEIKDDAKIDNAIVTVHGDVQIVGSFNLKGGTRMIYGKHVIASPDDVNRPELPPTKATW